MQMRTEFMVGRFCSSRLLLLLLLLAGWLRITIDVTRYSWYFIQIHQTPTYQHMWFLLICKKSHFIISEMFIDVFLLLLLSFLLLLWFPVPYRSLASATFVAFFFLLFSLPLFLCRSFSLSLLFSHSRSLEPINHTATIEPISIDTKWHQFNTLIRIFWRKLAIISYVVPFNMRFTVYASDNDRLSCLRWFYGRGKQQQQ